MSFSGENTFEKQEPGYALEKLPLSGLGLE